MPCMKCSNGKYKYGEHGKCVFDTLAACKAAAAAIHIQDKADLPMQPIPGQIVPEQSCNPFHDPTCPCYKCNP